MTIGRQNEVHCVSNTEFKTKEELREQGCTNKSCRSQHNKSYYCTSSTNYCGVVQVQRHSFLGTALQLSDSSIISFKTFHYRYYCIYDQLCNSWYKSRNVFPLIRHILFYYLQFVYLLFKWYYGNCWLNYNKITTF